MKKAVLEQIVSGLSKSIKIAALAGIMAASLGTGCISTKPAYSWFDIEGKIVEKGRWYDEDIYEKVPPSERDIYQAAREFRQSDEFIEKLSKRGVKIYFRTPPNNEGALIFYDLKDKTGYGTLDYIGIVNSRERINEFFGREDARFSLYETEFEKIKGTP
jgi:hypothetical protein